MRRRSSLRRAVAAATLATAVTILGAALALAAPRSDSGSAGPGHSATARGHTKHKGSTDDPSATTTVPDDPGATSSPAGTTTDDVAAPGQVDTTPVPADSMPSVPVAPVAPAAPAAGKVTVVLPGSGQSVELTSGMALPAGTVVDATAGSVQVPSPGGGSPGVFSGGRFIVGQTGGATPRTELKLTGGSFAACPTPAAATRATASSVRLGRHAVVRQLWGHDHHGRFTTTGRYASAAVRGTTWLTQDRCDGTRIAVTHGAVAVHDAARHRTVVVRAGHSFLVRKP